MEEREKERGNNVINKANMNDIRKEGLRVEKYTRK